MVYTVKELLNKIDDQITQLIFIHQNPTQASELKTSVSELKATSNEILKKAMKKMDELQLKINKIQGIEIDPPSTKKYVEFVFNKRKNKFDDTKCYSKLVKTRGIKPIFANNKKPMAKSGGKTLSYEFKEKLTGFLTKKKVLEWNDGKLDDFMKSLMK